MDRFSYVTQRPLALRPRARHQEMGKAKLVAIWKNSRNPSRPSCAITRCGWPRWCLGWRSPNRWRSCRCLYRRGACWWRSVALIGVSGISFWPIWLAAAAGAAAGDWLSYWFGRRFKSQIEHMWPLSQFPGRARSRRTVRAEMGYSQRLHRPLLGAAARDRAAGRRRQRDALLAIPVRERLVGAGLVRSAAGTRDVRRENVVVTVIGMPLRRMVRRQH